VDKPPPPPTQEKMVTLNYTQPSKPIMMNQSVDAVNGNNTCLLFTKLPQNALFGNIFTPYYLTLNFQLHVSTLSHHQRDTLQGVIDIFANYNWVDTDWRWYSTHLHTNNTQNNTINLGRVRAVPRLCELYPGICHTTDGQACTNLNQYTTHISVYAQLL